ncbi:MAG: GNAT family N-acetyltransferase [Kofleriaceae bacterium]
MWSLKAFDDLTTHELYRIIELRERVFVVEQACVYLDADGLDPKCLHLFDAQITAYARIVPAGVKFADVSIGRVVVAPEARGGGRARELMTRAIAACNGPIRIGAQAYLEAFYASLGFARVSENFLEDGIPHLEMLRPAGS